MKIGIKGFKSIKNIKDFSIKDINLLAGENSSGKSSLTQALLLLKQTIESDSKELLKLNGPYVYADKLLELLYRKQKSTFLEYNLSFNREDIITYFNIEFFEKFIKSSYIKEIRLHIVFQANGGTHLQNFEISLISEEEKESFLFIKRNKNSNANIFQVYASSYYFLGLWDENSDKKIKLNKCTLEFSNFLPSFGECKAANTNITLFKLPIIIGINELLRNILSNIYYISPIRVKPVLWKTYETTPSINKIEPDGNNTRFVLAENKNLILNDNKSLLEAINYWVFDKLQLAKDIQTTKNSNQLYRTQLHIANNLSIDLCHMGFGISQILPIIIQGLMLPENGIFIVEDPCVHMHPSIQAKMMDFFLEMNKIGNRKIIIETHSDHIVTRLRRRIAEGLDASSVNLIFVELSEEGSIYQKIDVTKQGAFYKSLPKGFLDTSDEDFRAILKARI